MISQLHTSGKKDFKYLRRQNVKAESINLLDVTTFLLTDHVAKGSWVLVRAANGHQLIYTNSRELCGSVGCIHPSIIFYPPLPLWVTEVTGALIFIKQQKSFLTVIKQFAVSSVVFFFFILSGKCN